MMAVLRVQKKKKKRSTAYIHKTKNSSLLWNEILNSVSWLHYCDYLSEKRVEERVSPILKNDTYYTFGPFPQLPYFSLRDLTQALF